MEKKCVLQIFLGLFLITLISGLAPKATFSADRMDARRGRTVPAETPPVSAPKSDIDASSLVKTAPSTIRDAADAEKAQFGVTVQNLTGTAYWRMLGRHTERK